MSSCVHASFLQVVSDDSSLSLCNTRRLDRLCKALPDPARQSPSFLFFLGSGAKDQALSHIFKLDRLKRGARDGGNSLRVDPATVLSENPLLVAESDIQLPLLKRCQYLNCHESRTHKVVQAAEADYGFAVSLHARLFFLFADVICIFTADFGGVSGTVDFLRACLKLSSSSTAPRQIRPRVVLVGSPQEDSATLSVLQVEELRYRLLDEGEPDLHELFSQISIFEPPGDHVSPRVRYRSLHECITKHAQQLRQVRSNSSYLFNALHLAKFFDQAVYHASKDISLPFSFILESRRQNPLDSAFHTHLSRFLTLSAELKVPHDAVASFIASAITLDAYPPGMHSKYIEGKAAATVS